jgi:putative heme-binding domain-containing protein
VYGGVYGKDHAVLDGHVRTGSLMPIMTHMGAAAPAGLIAGSAGLFGGGHEDDLLACYFNLRKVVLHRLKATGATYETQEQDLLSCEHPDFHPTDVLEDADGSVLIVDTGGWYKVCCPTSVLARPDVPGAIYRVRKKGQAKVDDPLGLKLPWATMSPKELAALLADKRLFVRRRAQDLLRQAGADGAKAAVLFLRSTADVGAAREAVWTLGGIGGDDARWGVRRALTHPSPEVVRSAVHAAGLWRDGGADDAINKLVLRQVVRPETRDGVFRPAAEALGRIGGPKAVHAVSEMLACGTGSYEVDATGTPTDADQRVLQHSLIYALIELGDIDHLQRMLAGPGARYRRGGLVAMASLDPDRIRVADLLPLLRKDPEIANTVTWLASRQPKWGPAFATYLRERVSELPEEAHLRDRLAALLVACTPLPDVQVLVAERLRTETNPARRSLLLTAMRQARLTSAPAAWCDVVADQLVAAPDGERTELLAIARTLAGGRKPHDGLTTALLGLAARTTLPAATRIDALSVAGAGVSLDDALLADVLKMTAATEPATVRQSAVAVVGAAKLTKAQHVLVVDALATAGPMELPKLLAVLEKADANEETGRRMLTAVRKSPGLVSLRPEQINPLIALFPQSVRDAAADLTSRRSATAAEQGAHLDALLAALPPGDVARGQGVFIGKKAACVSCHATGYLGGKLGPDLTGIGKIRSDRDLLEAIVYPSSGFVRGYEPVIVETKDGEKHVGIITTESRDEIQLAVGPQETRSLSREQISDQRPGQNSLMPDGMSAVLSQQELADLLAFLRAAKR